MGLPALPDVAIGSVAAALIAAVISFVGLVISKENKTSEFRQAWIDSLRAELASMIANLNAIRGAAAAESWSKEGFFTATRELFVGANVASTAIRLRLNPNEPECKAVLLKLSELEKFMHAVPFDIPACRNCEDQLIASAHVLLKKEWARVRRGEWTFALAKWGGFIVAMVILLWLAYTWFTAAQSANLRSSVPAATVRVGPASTDK